MKVAMRAGGLCCSVVAMLLVGSLLFAQDGKKSETKAPETKAETAKKVRNRLPDNFAKLSLSDEQKKKIYTVQASYAPQIDELMAQLKALKDKEGAEIDAVLTPEQLKLLGSIRAESKQKQEAAKAAKAKRVEKKEEKKAEGEAVKKPEGDQKPATEKK